MRRLLPVFLSSLILGTLVACSHGCAGDDVASTDAGSDSNGDRAESTTGDGSNACVPPARPAGVPVGWELETTYWPCCGIYMPTAKDQMPEPIVWEACQASNLTPGLSCRQMKVDWVPPKDATTAVSAEFKAAWKNPNGDITLMIERWKEEGHYRLFVDADGPVRAALLQPKVSACIAGMEDVGSGYYVYKMYETPNGGGAVVGKLDDPKPSYAQRLPDGFNAGFRVGSHGLMKIANGQQITVQPWSDLSKSILVASPATQKGRQQNAPYFWKETLFWNSSTGSSPSELMEWTPDGGTSALVTTEPDWTKGVHAMSTDGVDMVWSYGENRTKPSEVFGENFIMTAPFTTDSSALKPRQVRKTGGYGWANQYAVGCGYAARNMSYQATGGELEVVRLADGHAWSMDTKLFLAPIAITCDEIFALASFDGKYQVARVRLDSLGAGQQ